jgi:hypothetical protein
MDPDETDEVEDGVLRPEAAIAPVDALPETCVVDTVPAVKSYNVSYQL